MVVGIQPAQVARQIDHAHAHFGTLGGAREVEKACPRSGVASQVVERLCDLGRLTRGTVERRRQLLHAVEVQAGLSGVPLQQLVNEVDLAGQRQAVVGEAAHVAPRVGLRVPVGHARGRRQREGREGGEQAAAGVALSDLAGAAGAEVAVQRRAGDRPQWCRRREAVDHRNVLEDLAHAVAAALAGAAVERLQLALGLLVRVTLAHQTAHDLGRRAALRRRVQRVAAKQVDFLQPREQPRTGTIAGDTLQLGDGQEFAHLELVGEERAAAVEVPGNDEHVAGEVRLAGRGQPVGTVALDKFDETVARRGQVAPEGVLLVGRVDRDGADRLLCGDRGRDGPGECCQCRCAGEPTKPRQPVHGVMVARTRRGGRCHVRGQGSRNPTREVTPVHRRPPVSGGRFTAACKP